MEEGGGTIPAPVVAAAAVPLAEAGVKYAADISKSIVAQISDALRTPLLKVETTETRTTRRGSKTTTHGAALPTWAVVVGGLAALVWLRPPPPSTSGLNWPWWVPIHP